MGRVDGWGGECRTHTAAGHAQCAASPPSQMCQPPGQPGLWRDPWGAHCFTVKVKVLVTQLCLALCDPMDHSLPVSSVHWIFQT